MRPFRFAVLLSLLACSLFAASPYLVKDINQGLAPLSSYPDHFLTVGSFAYFTTTDGYDQPVDLWRTDGTDAGTIRLAAGGWNKAVWNGKLWFLSSAQSEIWSTDGTVAGTTKMTMPAGMPSPALASNLMAGPNHLYFTNGNILWQTDGTPESTVQASTISFSMPSMSNRQFWASTPQALFFVATGDGTTGLWRTDSSGTAVLSATSPQYSFWEPAAAGNLIYISQWDNSNATHQLWRSDGTASGTFALKTPSQQTLKASLTFITMGSNVSFVADDGSGSKLWTSDGTSAGTTAVATSLPGASATFDAWPIAGLKNGTKLFLGTSPQPNGGAWGLWAFDGTNTTFLANVPGGNTSFFGTTADTWATFGTGGALWRSDGTVNGTFSLGTVNGSDGTRNWPMAALGSIVFLGGSDNTHGFELWKTDGTTAAFFKDLAVATNPSNPATFRAFRGGLLFTAIDGTTDATTRDLWFSDGTEAGTQKILANFGYVDSLTPCGTRAFFNHYTPDSGSELWVTDGTSAGTMMLTDLFPGSGGSYANSSYPTSITCVDAHVLFYARSSPNSTAELWRSDGTVSGTMMVKFLGGPPNASEFSVESGLYRRGHEVWFVLRNNYHEQLWRSDGTPGGTILVKEAATGDWMSRPFFSGPWTYFTTSSSNATLWRSDGTTAGTTAILTDSYLIPLADFYGRLVFTWMIAGGFTNGYCATDGINAPVCFDKDISASGWWTFEMKPLNGKLYYNKPDLFSSDGTSSAATGVKDVIKFLSTAGGRQYFNNDYKLMESDGTPAGTMLLMNEADETAVSSGRLFISSGELYAYDIPVIATGLAPQSVDPAGGQSVTIAGRGFTGPVTVTVGGVAATVGSVTDSSIVFTAPAHDVGTYDVELILGDGRRMTVDTPLAYTCAPLTAAIGTAPAPVCPLAPAQLQGSGGTRCAWFPGTGLDNASSCTPKASVTTTTTYTLMVFNASGCASTNNPTVTVSVMPPPDATISIAGVAIGYYYTPLTANATYTASVPDAGTGATYAWSGSGITIDDPTLRSITFHTSCISSGSLTATVTAPNGCSSTRTLTFEISPAPTVTSFSPRLVNPGTTVTIAGSALQCTTQVNLIDQNGRYLLVPVTSANATTVQFRFPGNGPRVSYPYVETAHTPNSLVRAVHHDFDMNTTSDIMWRSTAGYTSFWFFRSSGVDGEWSITVPTDWQPVAFGDFDGDGITDIFWRNSTTGETSIWLMSAQSNGMPATTVRSMTIPTDWVPVGSGDFDGDGKIDIFWRNAKTGETSIWYMNGINFTGVRSWTIPTSWFPVAFGDFDADGKTDIFWWNPTTGETSVWLMNGTFPSVAVRSVTVDPSWVPVGAGDFNRDWKDDLFWFNRSTGQTGVWYMNGTSIASWANLVTMPSGWRPIQIGFYGDAYPFTFWYNDITGETGLWHHQPSGPSWTAYQTVSDTSWKPVSLP